MSAGPAMLGHVAPVRRSRSFLALWHEDYDGFMHRSQGRFYLRRNPRHIERCRNLIAQRNAADESVRVEA